MRFWTRVLLTVLLAIGLPLQGWAAARMATDMAGQTLAVHAAAPADDPTESATGTHSDMAGHHDHACCDPLQNGAQADHSSSTCGHTCHCCISAAPMACMPMVQAAAPPHDWFALAPVPCTTVQPATPEKPPKA